MSKLLQTIEEVDPGHFLRRRDILEKLRSDAASLGFYPLPLSQQDIECFWIRLEPNGQVVEKNIYLQRDYIDDEYYLTMLKEVAKHE